VGHSTLPRAQTRWLATLRSVAACQSGCCKCNVLPTALQAVGHKSHQKSDTDHLGPCTAHNMQSAALCTASLCRGNVCRCAHVVTTSPNTQRRRPALAPSAPSRLQRARSETKTIFGRQNWTCFHGKCTMTLRSDTRFAHIHTPALPSCSQIACFKDVEKSTSTKHFALHLPCPYLLSLRAIAMLPLFARFESSASCVRSARTVCSVGVHRRPYTCGYMRTSTVRCTRNAGR